MNLIVLKRYSLKPLLSSFHGASLTSDISKRRGSADWLAILTPMSYLCSCFRFQILTLILCHFKELKWYCAVCEVQLNARRTVSVCGFFFQLDKDSRLLLMLMFFNAFLLHFSPAGGIVSPNRGVCCLVLCGLQLCLYVNFHLCQYYLFATSEQKNSYHP